MPADVRETLDLNSAPKGWLNITTSAGLFEVFADDENAQDDIFLSATWSQDYEKACRANCKI